MATLRDILYFDFDKAASLISQIEGGLAQEIAESTESTGDQRNIRKYELLNVLKTEFGGVESEKRSILETKVLHHDLLLRLEDVLFSNGFAFDVNEVMNPDNVDDVRERIRDIPYLRAEGWCAIEDFDRIYEITKHFNDLHSFVRRSELRNKYQMDELEKELESVAEEKGKNAKDYKQKNAELRELDKNIKAEIESSKLPNWLFEGIRLWIDSLAKHRLNIRLVPYAELREFQVIANLKRECFVDTDLEHLLYGYGSQPNKKLCVLGLVTSLPAAPDEDVYSIYEKKERSDETDLEEDQADIEAFESAFRGLFPAIEGMEKFTSYHHYPRVVVHPIAVFRNIHSIDSRENET